MFISFFGVKICVNSPLFKGLTNIYGINRSQAKALCCILGISTITPYKILSSRKRKRVRELFKSMVLGPRLLQMKFHNIKILKSTRSYRGFRHKFKLPVRGQRSRTNAKTQKKRGL